MEFEQSNLEGVLVFTPKLFADDRGFFMETFRQSVFDDAVGESTAFVQDNHSYSKDIGTVRGLHYQRPPFAQGKLVRCTKGAIIDVAVDIRKGSPNFGQSVNVELSSENRKQLWIPAGFLHGFVTLEANCEVSYKCTNYYDHSCDAAVHWTSPGFDIEWGVSPAAAILSDKDLKAPAFQEIESPFRY